MSVALACKRELGSERAEHEGVPIWAIMVLCSSRTLSSRYGDMCCDVQHTEATSFSCTPFLLYLYGGELKQWVSCTALYDGCARDELLRRSYGMERRTCIIDKARDSIDVLGLEQPVTRAPERPRGQGSKTSIRCLTISSCSVSSSYPHGSQLSAIASTNGAHAGYIPTWLVFRWCEVLLLTGQKTPGPPSVHLSPATLLPGVLGTWTERPHSMRIVGSPAGGRDFSRKNQPQRPSP